MIGRVTIAIFISLLFACGPRTQNGGEPSNQLPSGSDSTLSRATASGPHNVVTGDSGYYFFFKGQLRDVRDLSVVMEEVRPGSAILIDEDTFLLQNDRHYRVYENGMLRSQYTVDGYIAPNLEYVVSLEDGDLWRAELNPRDGTTHSKTRLTELGIFQREFQYTNWYEEKIFFFASAGAWLLDTKTRELSQAQLDCFQNPQASSPTGRYLELSSVVGGDDCSGQVYDFETDRIHRIGPFVPGESYWLDDGIFASMIGDERGRAAKFSVMEFPGAEKIREFEVPRSDGPVGCLSFDNYNRYVTGYKGPSYLFEKYHLCTLFKETGERQIFFVNVDTGATVPWDVEFSEVKQRHPTRTFLRRTWASQHHMIYTSEGSLLTQGTWVVDARTGSMERITPYLAEMYWSFRSAGIAMFRASGRLYRCNADGSNLVVVAEEVSPHDHLQLFAPGLADGL